MHIAIKALAVCFVFVFALVGSSFAQSWEERESWVSRDIYLDFPMDGVLELAKHGNAKAQTSIGFRYETGRGVRKDRAEAARWYKKAADQGFAHAQVRLGLLFQLGEGIPQSYSEALQWFQKAADQGDALGQMFLASMYMNGWGSDKNFAEGVRWLKLSADQGAAPAQATLGMLYEAGKGVPQDYGLAVHWYRLAAAQGEEESQKRLPIAEKKLAEAKAKGQYSQSIDAETLNDFPSYSRRPRTLLEEVLNYSTTGNENGKEDFYWTKSPSDGCSLDLHGGPSELTAFGALASGVQLNVPKTINIHSFNETAFSIDVSPILDPDSGKFTYSYAYGDPNYMLKVFFIDPILDENPRPEETRLHKAWELAFKECPGKRSRF